MGVDGVVHPIVMPGSKAGLAMKIRAVLSGESTERTGAGET